MCTVHVEVIQKRTYYYLFEKITYLLKLVLSYTKYGAVFQLYLAVSHLLIYYLISIHICCASLGLDLLNFAQIESRDGPAFRGL